MVNLITTLGFKIDQSWINVSESLMAKMTSVTILYFC